MTRHADAAEASDILLRDDAEGVATLRLNRPQSYNALSVALMRDLHAALDAVAADPTIRVVVIAGAGLVNRVVPDGDLEVATAELAGRIATKSPLTLSIGKEAFYRQAEMDLAAAYAYASDVMTRNMMARDAEIGIDALLSRTRPTWCGK